MKYLVIAVLLLLSVDVWATDNSIYDDSVLVEPTSFIFGGRDGEEILNIKFTGEIYYKGRLITKDKDLVKAFYAVVSNCRCPKCGRLLDNYTTKDK